MLEVSVLRFFIVSFTRFYDKYLVGFSSLFFAEFIAKFVVPRCAFCKLRRNFEFFCSVNHLNGPLRKPMFTCDWCISIHLVCFCISRFAVLVIAPFRSVSGNGRLVFFQAFYDLSYSCLLQEDSNVCIGPSTKSPLIIAISFTILEQFGVILNFVFAGQAWRVHCNVICINFTPTQMIDGTEKPIRSLQTRSAIQRVWL